jgi:16S rRNA processing protein RimM
LQLQEIPGANKLNVCKTSVQITIFAAMETIPKADCTKIGFIRKTRGVHGEMVLEFEERFEFSAEEATQFFLEIDGLLVPFFVAENGSQVKSAKTAFVNFKWVDSEKYAQRLVGASVYIFTSEIVDEPEDAGLSQLQGFTLFDKNTGEIGVISHVEDFSGNTVLTIGGGNEELLIPFNEDFLADIDPENKTLTLELPEGLLDESD